MIGVGAVLIAACNQPTSTPPQAHGPPAAFYLEPDFELQGEADASPRSIVVISLDTVRADRLEIYGGRALTPTLAGVAREGLRFDAAFSPFPETCPAHWAMLSGQPPEAHGAVVRNRGSRSRTPTLAEIARMHRYATGAFIGGSTLQDPACGLSRGFQVYDDDFVVNREDMRRPAAQVSAAAQQWIAAQTGPYFAFVHFFDAHFPYTPPPPWDRRYDPDYSGTIDGSDRSLDPYRRGERRPDPRDLEHVLALYDGELSALDEAIAGLVAAIPKDAVLIITSDHGESFEHDYWFNHRAALWDPVIAVPLLVRAPGVPAGASRDELVSLIDLTPTALRLAGLPVDRRFVGQDLGPLIRGQGGGRSLVVSMTDPDMPDPQRSARTATRKRLERQGQVWLYELDRDPLELSPRRDQPDALRAELRAWEALIAPRVAAMVPAPASATPRSPQELELLEALGYVDPSPPGPP